MRRLLLLGAIFLGLAANAQAHPVSPRRAALAIRFDSWDFGTTPPVVDSCIIDRYGTLCIVTSAVCYTDMLGPAVDTDTNRVWVSRTRGRVAVALLPGTTTAILAAPDGCGVGQQP